MWSEMLYKSVNRFEAVGRIGGINYSDGTSAVPSDPHVKEAKAFLQLHRYIILAAGKEQLRDWRRWR